MLEKHKNTVIFYRFFAVLLSIEQFKNDTNQ